ncbi:unnamed protein product [Paramecium sonneborni]|uniref:Thioredoxin-like fold domain-containing protein n=1 Tax=Paramecium sonneborni TaxID=65129 RepID=A0A8S1RAL0_9CILI|nr:unnamed protein product [Paramecium sonneborni]
MSNKIQKKIVKSILKELPPNKSITEHKVYTANSQSDQYQTHKEYTSNKNFLLEEADNYYRIRERIKQQKDEINQDDYVGLKDLLKTMKPQHQLGDMFNAITEIERIQLPNEKKLPNLVNSFEVEGGFIYLINVWGIEDEETYEPIDEVVKLFKRNITWKDKVKCVAICIDSNSQEIINIIQQKKWDIFDHYCLLPDSEIGETFLDNFNVEEIPMAILVNKWGRIVCFGLHDHLQIEEKIKQQLQAKENIIIQKDDEQINNTGITQEQFKMLKAYFIDLWLQLQNQHFDGEVQINLTKQNQWKQDGSKTFQQGSKLELNYSLEMREKEKIQAFIEKYWSVIPESFRVIENAQIKDLQKLQKEIQQKFQKVFATKSVTLTYPEMQKISIFWNQKKKIMEIENNKSFVVKQEKLNLVTYEQGINELEKYLEQISQDVDAKKIADKIQDELKSAVILGPGKKFAPLKFYKMFGSNENKSIDHKLGQVLVIFYWLCEEECVKMIDDLIEFQVTNVNKWGQNVRIVACNIAAPEDSKQLMEDNPEFSKNIEIYFKKKSSLTDTSLYGVSEVPYFVIVDKFGYIRKLKEVENFEEYINKLLKEDKKQEIKKQHKSEKADLISKLMQTEEISKLILNIDPQNVISLKISFDVVKVANDQLIQQSSLKWYVRDSQVEEFNKLLKQVFEIIPENDWVIDCQIQKTLSLKYPGLICALCKKDISKENQQYYCYFKDEHVCVDCAEFDDKNEKGMKRYKYQHTLIFINGPLTNLSVLHNIDSHKIGKNLQLAQGYEGNQRHEMDCDGCRISSKGPRYILINSKPGQYDKRGYHDLCEFCFQKIKNKGSQEAIQIMQKLGLEKLNEDTLFTRVLFNYGNYRDF